MVAGYTRGKGRRAGTLGSLVLGTYEGGELVYVGNVGTGFNDKEIDRLLTKLKPLERDTPPFAELPKMPRVRKGDVVWVEPKLVAEVEFVEWTHDGRLRAPAYKGLREDKDAARCAARSRWRPEIRKGKRVLKLSNLDKPFWPDEGITKGDLLSYYQSASRRSLVPHLKDRPVHDEALPRRLAGQVLLPEGRAEAHAGVDPDARRSSSRLATSRGRGGGSERRS